MNVQIHEPAKIVEIMLTHTEQADEEVRKQLKKLYAQYKGTKYTVAVFLSGKRDLYEDTRDLLLFNRRRAAEGHNISENALRGLVDSKKCLWRVIEKYFGEKPQKKCRKCCRCKSKTD